MPPSLPPEVWLMIASYLPYLPNEPVWRPWQNYRNVCKLFRDVIERYYMTTILPATVLIANFEPHLVRYPCDRPPLAATFKFTGFTDPSKRLAMLRWADNPRSFRRYDQLRQTDTWHFPNEAEKTSFKHTLMQRIVKTRNSSHPGYTPYESLLLAYDQPNIDLRAAIDFVPFDLGFDPSTMSYIFNWRDYFNKVLWERGSGPRRWDVILPGKGPVHQGIWRLTKDPSDYIIEPPSLTAPEWQTGKT